MDHVDEEVWFEIHRGIDIRTIALTSVNPEQFVCTPGRVALGVEVTVASPARPEPITGFHRVGRLPAQRHAFDG